MARHRFAASVFLALLTLVLLVGGIPPSAQAKWVDLGGNELEVTVLQSDGERTVIEFSVGGFDAQPVEINGETYYEIFLGREGVGRVKGFPAVPDVRRSIVIPDRAHMNIRVLESEYVDLPEMPVVPWKGDIPRTIDPQTVPYEFSDFYFGEGTYPPEIVELHDPYILRDFRGAVVDANVFQYTPATRTLRVYQKLVVEVYPDGPGRINTIDRTSPPEKVDVQFSKIYRERFINFDRLRYDPVPEEGGLLIICYDSFVPNVQPLLEWKLQKGIRTKLVPVSEAGSSPTAIKTYISNEYAAWGLAYVLLVGDAAQVPTFSYSGGGADPLYATIVGSDDYPDIFVGRFSAENTSQVDTQVERTIAYERDAAAGVVWPQYGTGIASNQGPGHHGEYDNEHEDLIRQDLLDYGYFEVDQIYDPGATAAQVSAALNEGRGIVNYTGHGSTTSWGTTGFDNGDVNALVNDYMLPFIMSVACYNGNFTGTTCFGEAWLRATHNGAPTGAIAAYMSSIGQYWNPPMDAQDEAVDLLVADEMRTIGGLWFNGSCLMIDINGQSGVDMYNTWIIFGDPSVHVRTKVPEMMTVNHSGVMVLGQDSYDVTVVGVEGALCALYGDGVLYGSALTDASGSATITLDEPPAEPTTLTLTVTAYNKVTYQGDVDVVPAAGPYLMVSEVEFIDEGGDGIINAGEHVSMRVRLRNVGTEDAINVSATISTDDEYVTIGVDERTYPDIPAGGEAWCYGTYEFDVASSCPDMHAVEMPIHIVAEDGLLRDSYSWDGTISFTVHAPAISVLSVEVDDTVGGNGNLRLDPGESATLTMTLENSGSVAIDNVTGVLTCGHPQVTINQDTGTVDHIDSEGTGVLEPPFEVEIGDTYALPNVVFYLNVTGDPSYERTIEVTLPVGGFYEPVESSPDWVHYNVTEGFTDQWHISTQRNHTPGGTRSWKCGDVGSGNYANLLDAGLETPAVQIPAGGELRFWMWIDAEVSQAYPGRCYDGGLVEMSVNGGPFEQIEPVGGYPYTIRPGSIPGPFPDGTPVFSGTFDWQQVVFEVPDVSGEVVFRFRFGSDGADTREGWYIDDIEILGAMSPSEVRPTDLGPSHVALTAIEPNPASKGTRISFALPSDQAVSLAVFDLNGRLVRSLIEGSVEAGFTTVTWDGRDASGISVPGGVYFCRLTTGGAKMQRPIVIVR